MPTRDLFPKAAMTGMLGTVLWCQLPSSLFQSPQQRAAIEASASYGGCDELRSQGKAPLRAGEPGYRSDMDGDGLACEPIR
ncbi:hypothetical protein HMF7854_03450 [Sphingomonas ginkgonis]|uniref:Excalibur calcium-binding domain-containing protein n=1 Tax=Sphingomonas ginkgonis TaxID=2315330 RepID=A0A429V7N5_9SPHN|nr:excalibur calcium-binding domain-containing protein [Sphingomonas ginkgonis]RST29986.1 hypothetical protein HMF7854_03450 [Sphingomonas ginkgonis]